MVSNGETTGSVGQMEDTMVDDQIGKSKHEPILETINVDLNRNNENFGIDIISLLRTGSDNDTFNSVIMSDIVLRWLLRMPNLVIW